MSDMGAVPPIEEVDGTDLGKIAEDAIRTRIAHVLSIYPALSMSMLQVGIGTGIQPAMWHVVLERMVEDGIISKRQVKATNPLTSREQVYTLVELKAA